MCTDALLTLTPRYDTFAESTYVRIAHDCGRYARYRGPSSWGEYYAPTQYEGNCSWYGRAAVGSGCRLRFLGFSGFRRRTAGSYRRSHADPRCRPDLPGERERNIRGSRY